MADSRTVVIVGGGVGGLVTANLVRRQAGREHRVVLVDREGRYIFTPSFPWVMTGARQPERIVRDLKVLERKGIEVVRGEVQAIDPAERRVELADGQMSGDYLVIALGADVVPGSVVPGFADAALNLYTLQGVQKLRDALRAFDGGKVVVAIEAMPYKCPAAPHEAAMLIEAALRRRGLRARSQVSLVTPESQPLPVAGPALGAAVRGMLEAKGIEFRPNTRIERVDPAAKRLELAGGETVGFDLLVGIPAHVCPSALVRSGLAPQGCWVGGVDRHTLRTPHENVFAIGDCVSLPIAGGKVLPKAGVFAHYEGEVVAANIAAAIRGESPSHRFDGGGECFIEMGDGRAGFAQGKFFAEPAPIVPIRRPGRWWHWGKLLFEWQWMRRWF